MAASSFIRRLSAAIPAVPDRWVPLSDILTPTILCNWHCPIAAATPITRVILGNINREKTCIKQHTRKNQYLPSFHLWPRALGFRRDGGNASSSASSVAAEDAPTASSSLSRCSGLTSRLRPGARAAAVSALV